MGRWYAAVLRWFDSDTATQGSSSTSAAGVDWTRIVPFVLVHAVCIAVIWVGWSPVALLAALTLYLVRMFAITAFYHRYFSHRSFKTSRAAQLMFGLLGASAVQRGPIWLAAHHRHHHAHSDQPDDVHSPVRHGFLQAHMGWFLTREGFDADTKLVRDLLRFPELIWLDRFDIAVPFVLAVVVFLVGCLLQRLAPSLGTSGWQLLVWGFFVSTVLCYHCTYLINSLSHVVGRQRYRTGDSSRNNWLLALITLGEGWHNNHHHYPNAARQGFYWWEIDITFYLLKLLSWLGVIWDLRIIPVQARDFSARRLAGPKERYPVRP
jgi:stearoyl-CoA desaturase (delta-9 desaturase)